MRKSLLIIFSSIISIYAFAYDTVKPLTTYKHFSEAEGLTAKTVYSIIQDKNGFIWFATDAGAFRYDGKEFKHYTVDDGISDNEILNIFQDKTGRIWFMTLNGYLSYWYKGSIYNRSNTPFLKDAYLGASVACCHEDSRGRLWFGCIKSGFILIENNQVKKYIYPFKDRPATMQFTYEDTSGNIWYFQTKEMINISSKESISLLHNIGLYMGCYSEKNYNIYYCDQSGISKLIDKKMELVIDSSLTPSFLKIINLQSEKNDIWLCTLGEGCYFYHDGKIIERYLPDQSVTSTLKDREGNLWFSTMSDGVSVLYNNKNYITNFDQSSGLSESKIICLAIQDSTTMWLGYNNGKVDRIKNNTISTYKITKPSEPSFCRITSLLSLHDTTWGGTDFRLFYISNEKVTDIHCLGNINENLPYAIKQVIKDNNDNIYATFCLNFLKVSKIGNKFSATALLDSVSRTFSALETKDNSFLVSGMNGVMELSPEHYYKIFNADFDLSNERILDMKYDADGMILFASNSNGLFIMNNRKLMQHLTIDNGLSDNNCRRLFIIDNILFVSTANGLDVLIKRKTDWIPKEILTTRNGLLSNSINDVSADKNNLYVATDRGLSIVKRNTSEIPVYTNKVIITEILTDKSVSVNSESYSFKRDIPRLLIRFSYPVYNPISRSKIKYRLVKEKENAGDWNVSRNNEVEFSSLLPGSYSFQVKPDIKTSENIPVTNLTITIIPLWYETTTARSSIILVLLGFSFLIIRRLTKSQYERRLAEQKQLTLLELERNRIASDMHDDIGGDLTQITIWSNILKAKISGEKVIVDKVSNLSNEVLKKMDQIIWALDSIHNQTGHLISYLHAYASEYLESADIRLVYSANENIPDITIGAFQRRNIFLVVKELLHNTVKHSNASMVNMNLNIENGKIIIEYTDDGKGLPEEMNNDGLGMTTIKKRMSEINSSIEINPIKMKGFYALLKIDIGLLNKNNNFKS